MSARRAHNPRLPQGDAPRSRAVPRAAQQVDLAVIGAGPAGLAAAVRAAETGRRVVLFESARLGGASLNSGSVPSKALIRSATLFANMREVLRLRDQNAPDPVADLARIERRLRLIETRIARYCSPGRLADLGIELCFAAARFVDPRTLLAAGVRYQFARAVIASGATSTPPQIPGLREGMFITSEDVFDLKRLPRRLAVVGGGPLGCELAQAFCRLGCQVTIVQDEAKFLPKEERDAAQILARAMARDGVNIMLNTRVIAARRRGAAVRLKTENYRKISTIEADTVLVSVGRRPRLDGLNLSRARIRYRSDTGILVNDYLATSNPRVYAAGDVCTEHKYTHVAEETGWLAADNALGLRARRYSALRVPWCTFCAPEVAHVGLQVWEARRAGLPIRTITVLMQDVDRAITDRQENGFVKLHIADGTDKIVGATIVASRASEMINEVCVAMHAGIGLRQLARVVHTYPSQSAALRMAARSVFGTPLT